LSVTGTVGFDGLTAGAGAGALCLSANKEVTYSDGAACTGSSERFKHDIESLDARALETVLSLRPVSFFYNDDIGVRGEQVGLIAEEVFDIDPRLVALDSSSLPVNVKYANLTAVLAKAIQEFKAVFDRLAVKIEPILTWFVGGKFMVQNDICVDDVCVTKEQFKQMLLNNGGGGGSDEEEPEEVLEDDVEVVDTPPIVEDIASSTPETATTTETTIVEDPEESISTSTDEVIIEDSVTEETVEDELVIEESAPEPTPEPTLEPVTEPAPVE
jgi:hypothetical protein